MNKHIQKTASIEQRLLDYLCVRDLRVDVFVGDCFDRSNWDSFAWKEVLTSFSVWLMEIQQETTASGTMSLQMLENMTVKYACY